MIMAGMDASREKSAKTYKERREPSYVALRNYKTRYEGLRRHNNKILVATGTHLAFQGFHWNKYKITGGIDLNNTQIHQE